MTMRRFALIPVLTCLCAVLGFSGIVGAADTERAERLYQVGQFDPLWAPIPQAFVDGMAEAGQPLDAAQTEKITALANGIFGTKALRAVMVPELAAGLNAAQFDTLIGFFGTGVGKRAVDLEIAANAKSGDPAYDAAGTALFAQLVETDDPRAEIYQRMMASMRAIDRGVAFGMNFTYALMVGQLSAPDAPTQFSDAEVLDMINGMEPEIRTMITETYQGYFAMAYRDLSVDDLMTYATFLDTPAGQAYMDAVWKGMSKVMVTGAPIFGREAFAIIQGRKT